MQKPISTRINSKTYEAFDEVCKATHISKSKLMEEGVEYIVEKYSNLDKKLQLVREMEEAEADVKAGKFYTLKDVDEMFARHFKNKRKKK